jgi:glycerol-3-phosphate acyltransferase PlsY
MALVDISIFLVIAGGYLTGSIPFGYLIARSRHIDIMSRGSGNIGAANIFRTLGPILGVSVFILDLAKGALPVYLSQQVTQNHWLILSAGMAAVFGHAFSVFLRFRGGRGSATGLGVLLAIAPDIFLGAFLLVIAIILITRYVSLASILVPPLVVAAFLALKRPLPYALAASLVTALIVGRHLPNIKRLWAGTEPRIGEKQ